MEAFIDCWDALAQFGLVPPYGSPQCDLAYHYWNANGRFPLIGDAPVLLVNAALRVPALEG